MTQTQDKLDFERIATAIDYLANHYQEQPDLSAVAAQAGLSEYHFQRLFTRWAGVSPKQFAQYLTVLHAKKLLKQSRNLLDVAYETGLSGPGRLHDLFVTLEAVTPGEYKQQGTALTIQYGFHATPFGRALLGLTERGICALRFIEDEGTAAAELSAEWPGAELVADQAGTAPIVAQIFAEEWDGERPFKLYLKGTNFQIKVWQALLKIPAGQVAAYNTVATLAGQPSAARAVGNACAHNPIGYIIPCHRVIRQAGQLGAYRWGATRKQAILGREAAQANLS